MSYLSKCKTCGKEISSEAKACPNCGEPDPHGGCFITSACTQYLGKDDNCEELKMLRKFRDDYILGIKNGNEIVKMYYEIAPKIIYAINKSTKKNKELEYIYSKWIAPSIKLVSIGENELAFKHYCAGIKFLAKKYL